MVVVFTSSSYSKDSTSQFTNDFHMPDWAVVFFLKSAGGCMQRKTKPRASAPVILAPQGLKQEDLYFKTSLSQIDSSHYRQPRQPRKRNLKVYKLAGEK